MKASTLLSSSFRLSTVLAHCKDPPERHHFKYCCALLGLIFVGGILTLGKSKSNRQLASTHCKWNNDARLRLCSTEFKHKRLCPKNESRLPMQRRGPSLGQVNQSSDGRGRKQGWNDESGRSCTHRSRHVLHVQGFVWCCFLLCWVRCLVFVLR